MSIRLRRVEGVGLIAICAARSVEKLGDVYLDDTAHMALARKFWQDYPQLGITPDSDVIDATDREESSNPGRTWWDSEYGSAETASDSRASYIFTPDYVAALSKENRVLRAAIAAAAIRVPEEPK